MKEKPKIEIKEVYEKMLEAEERYVLNKTSNFIDSLEVTMETKNKVKQRLRK